METSGGENRICGNPQFSQKAALSATVEWHWEQMCSTDFKIAQRGWSGNLASGVRLQTSDLRPRAENAIFHNLLRITASRISSPIHRANAPSTIHFGASPMRRSTKGRKFQVVMC